MTEFLIKYGKDLISFIVLIASLIGAFYTFKKLIKDGFEHHDESVTRTMSEIDKKIENLSTKFALDNAKQNEENAKRFTELEKKIDDNERGRLRQEIFRTASDCRHGLYLSGEQFAFLRDQVVAKYHRLGGNDVGDAAWDYICKYYYKQCSGELREVES